MKIQRPIVLSGFMASGKSTVGPRLAATLGLPFVDTDDEIAREAGVSVPDLWCREGEAAFRAREAALVARLLDPPTPRVIAFGGGTVTLRHTRWLALDRAFVVTLRVSPESVVARAKNLAERPNLGVGDPLERARELMEQRADAYAECHVAVDTDRAAPDDIVARVLDAVARDPLVMPLGRSTYAIGVCLDQPERLRDAMLRAAPSSVVVVTDANVERARGDSLARGLEGLPIAARVVLPPGEANKTLDRVTAIWDAALSAGVDRDALVLAFGGGVVGDMAGFAAATLLRGVRFVQAPTTLLAMVDSSVGGKTGVDHPAGKNLLGAFHQPAAVVADLGHLRTLDPQERSAGLAEVVKIAFATDAPLFEQLEEQADALRVGDLEVLGPIVRGAIAAKIRVVRADERERGARALLNLGHTVGHALEALDGYSGLRHGEAVSIGLVAEQRAAVRLGLARAGLEDRLTSLLDRIGLPTSLGGRDLAAAWRFVSVDKKRSRDTVRLPVVPAIGGGEVTEVRLEELRRALMESAPP